MNDGRSKRASKLAPREIDVIRLSPSGLSVNEIAERLKKGTQMISSQKARAMKKLRVKRDVERIRCATCLDLIDETSVNRFEFQ